jgi:hypothetical protein
MVIPVRRRFDDDGWDDDLYDPQFYPRRVFRDGRGPLVPLYMTDAAPPRTPLMDGRMREHQRLLDGFARIGAAAVGGTAGHRPGQVSLSDTDVRAARSRSEHARAEWL